MLDYVKIRLLLFTLNDWNILRSIHPEAKVRRGSKGHYYFFWENLRIEYVPYLDQLWIKNSLHVFYNAVVRTIPIGRENYDDFSHENLKATIYFLCNAFNKQPSDFEMFGKFEFGANINVSPFQPIKIIDSYISLASTRINAFKADQSFQGGKTIGKSCYLTEYRVKFYDKSKASEIPIKGILRYEVCNRGVGRLKMLFSKSRVSLEDLLEKQNMQILSESLLKTYDSIQKLPIEQEVPREVMLELLAYSEPTMIDYDKKSLSPWKFGKQRAENKLLMNQYSNSRDSIHTWLRNKLVSKLDQLIN